MNSFKHIFATFAIILLSSIGSKTFAQSPPNISTDITWDSDPNTTGNQSSASTLVQIQNAYNNGRRQEEIQKSLPTNTLGNMTLPSTFLTSSIYQRAIILLNLERNCRAGVDYDGVGGVAPVLGLSFQGIDQNMNDVAQAHADWLVTNNLFQHTGAGGSTPFDRIQSEYPLNTCSEFLSRGESIMLLASSTPTITAQVEKAIYNWVYKDAASSWGHRESVLLQDMDLAGSPMGGFKNNFGTSATEGMVGIGIAGKNNNLYNPYGFTGMDRQEVVVYDIFDPVSTSLASTNNCAYSLVALPIELLKFTATQQNKVGIINWETATESNVDYFIVEKAENDGSFVEIGRVEAFGNSVTKRSYFFNDEKLKSGIFYYRLIAVDRDGEKSTSKVAVLRVVDELKFTVYPNVNSLDISLATEGNSEINGEILDLNGNLISVFQQELSSGFNRFSLNVDLQNGVYLMKISKNGMQKVEKFSYIR